MVAVDVRTGVPESVAVTVNVTRDSLSLSSRFLSLTVPKIGNQIN